MYKPVPYSRGSADASTEGSIGHNMKTKTASPYMMMMMMMMIRARILMTYQSFFPCEIDDATQYINLGYGAQAPKMVILS